MTMIDRVWDKARQNPRAIALPEGDDKRTVHAAASADNQNCSERSFMRIRLSRFKFESHGRIILS